MNYLQMGAQYLRDRMLDYSGIGITYKRGAITKEIRAIPARVLTDISGPDGVVFREVAKDFIIDQKALLDFGVPKPMRGDLIIFDEEGIRIKCVVTGELGFASHYEEADSFGKAWRIHTKKVE